MVPMQYLTRSRYPFKFACSTTHAHTHIISMTVFKWSHSIFFVAIFKKSCRVRLQLQVRKFIFNIFHIDNTIIHIICYVLIRSAQTKHKTFINIKHNTSSSGEGLLPRSWFNENAYDWYKNKTRS